jgi:hypothetical protein
LLAKRVIFGRTAALYGEITPTNGRVEQTNFDTYQILRMELAQKVLDRFAGNGAPTCRNQRLTEGWRQGSPRWSAQITRLA